MKKSLALTLLTSVLIPATIFAADIGVAGSVSSIMDEGSAQVTDLTDLRLSVSGDLSDTAELKAVIDVNDRTQVREAYVTLSDPFQELGIDFSIKGLSVEAGRKLVSFGKNNGTFAEDLRGVDTAYSSRALLGEYGLTGKGIGVLYSTDILGAEVNTEASLYNWVGSDWNTDSNEDPLYDAAPVFRTDSKTVALRLTSGLEVLNLEYGISALLNAPSAEAANKVTLYGVDASYSTDIMNKTLEIDVEYTTAAYTNVTDQEISRTAMNVYAGLDFGNDWSAGVRYDSLSSVEMAAIDGATEDLDARTEIALIAARELSDSTDLRIQYGIIDDGSESDDDSYLKASLVFNL
jgi:hypothetical protein